jgi:hypothetical protein
MAFRASVAAAAVNDSTLLFGNAELYQQLHSRADNWTQDIEVTGQKQFTAYTMNITYLICAVLCSLLAVVAITPLYWGDILVLHSFNPLDVARVFDAPILQDVSEAKTENYVRGENSSQRIRYSSKRMEITQLPVALDDR